MARIIKDIKDKNTGQLVYPKTHIKAVVIDSDTSLEDLIGTDVGNRLDTLESTIKTNGTGNLYLSDDGSYKEVITEFTETDPTVPAWAKAENKPTYTASEVGAQDILISGTNIKTINGQSVLGSGDIEVATEALKFENVSASTWVNDSTYSEFSYRCDMACSGVTANMYAEVAFAMEQATSGNYAPVCETKEGIVSIWSKKDESIVIPVIIITK